MDSRILNNFYMCKIKNILTISINPSKATPPSKGKLSGSKICPAHLQHCRKKASQILTDPAHPSNRLFQLLPSGRQYHSLRLQTTRFRNSFISLTVRLSAPNHRKHSHVHIRNSTSTWPIHLYLFIQFLLIKQRGLHYIEWKEFHRVAALILQLHITFYIYISLFVYCYLGGRMNPRVWLPVITALIIGHMAIKT